MDTDIKYLELVRRDLVDAATTEIVRSRQRSPEPGGPRWHRIVGVAAATIVVAGLVGWFATTGGFSTDSAGDEAVPAGETGAGATGATGEATHPADEQTIRENASSLAGAANYDAFFGDVAQEPPPGQPPSLVIREARLGLVIPPDSFDDRFAEVVDVASANDGYVATSTARERAGTLVIRVPAENFDETLGGLRALGDVTVQRITGQDVTAEYVDLQARLRIARSRREVLLRLMDQAVTIEQTIRVQNALDETQLRIEQLQGTLRLLDDRVALATIEVSLREEGVETVEEVETASLPNAFERSVAGFVGVVAAIVVGIGYLIPLLLIGLVGWGVVILVRRRRGA
ncbi:MAG: DUF4349 domain-containing protein [Actinobacteria bacterium]|nr:DUF4349 domain-containing protein [Actinomycetota bacterium]